MITVGRLTEAFTAAREAALAHDPGPENDGGTCNFDTPTVKLPRVPAAKVEAAAQAAGITVTETHWFGSRRFFVNVPSFGQANRRSAMAEAAGKVLREHYPDLNPLMYLQAD